MQDMNMRKFILELSEKVLDGNPVTQSEAEQLAQCSGSDLIALFAEASRIRELFFGNEISLCSIINAKSGQCPEDCAFCAQSVHHRTDIKVYPLVQPDEMVEQARHASDAGSECFGIITSGSGITDQRELETICDAVRTISTSVAVRPSCSLGIIDLKTAVTLREAGVSLYHHNLETAESFFPEICSTHEYCRDVETVLNAKRAGMKVCSGGIFGLGETFSQRIELALLLRKLEVDSIPINFLDPVEGTRLEGVENLSPLECLTIIAVFRFILPDRKITVCGGRERNLRELQSWIFAAGANGMMTGDYLTKKGRSPRQDNQLLVDLGLHAAKFEQ